MITGKRDFKCREIFAYILQTKTYAFIVVHLPQQRNSGSITWAG